MYESINEDVKKKGTQEGGGRSNQKATRKDGKEARVTLA